MGVSQETLLQKTSETLVMRDTDSEERDKPDVPDTQLTVTHWLGN